MTNYQNNLPPYAEEQTIQQKIKIPSNFIELGQPKKYWGPTEGLDKPLCERYNFKYNDKTVVLDISQKLIEKFGLKKKKTRSFGAYINKDLLKKTPEEGGITIDNEKDIICQTEGVVLFQEKQIQVDFTSGEITDLKQKLKKSEELSQETQKFLEIIVKDNEEKHIAIIFFETQIKDLTQRITELRQDLENEILAKKREESKNKELERIIRKLKEDEQVLIGLQSRISDLQRKLGDERLAWKETKEDLQNKIQEKGEHLAIAQWKFGNEILEGFRQINFLKREIDRLNDIIGLLERLTEGELNEKQGIINDLTIQKGDLQTQLDDKKQELKKWTDQFPNNQTPASVQGRINSLIGERDARPNISLNEWNTANGQKLTLDEQNAITWIQNCLTAMNNSLANSNLSYLDTYQSYFNPGGAFHSSIAGGITKYGRMNGVVTNLINTWNQTRNNVNIRNNQTKEINRLNNELQKEQGWWDKWKSHKEANVVPHENDKSYRVTLGTKFGSDFWEWDNSGFLGFNVSLDKVEWYYNHQMIFIKKGESIKKDGVDYDISLFISIIKEIYQYYRDK